MTTLKLVDKAMATAIACHGTQVNKHSDELYILHPMRVWIATRDGGLDFAHQQVAWLHDTIEDTFLTFEDIHGVFGDEVALAVHAMTKRKGESNADYYNRCADNLIARRVKIHDINENFGRNHLIEDEETKMRMARKYSLGLDILCRTHL